MKLISYNTSSAGGMMGGFSYTTIKYEEDGRCLYSSKDKNYHNAPTFIETFHADGLLEKMSELCEEYNCLSWTDLPDTNMVVYDAPSSTETFTFEDGTEITLSSRKQYPEKSYELFNKIKELIEEAKSQAEDIKIEEEPYQEMGMSFLGMMGQSMESFQNNNQIKEVPKTTEEDDKPKYCSECGAKNNGTSKFCSECGAILN